MASFPPPADHRRRLTSWLLPCRFPRRREVDQERGAMIGSARTRIRASSNTTTAPRSRSSAMTARLAVSKANWRAGCRSVPRRNKTTDGRVSARTASSVPKSVSADTRILPSAAALAKISSSEAVWSPYSLTCDASYPASRSPAAKTGDKALSMRNFTASRAAARVPVLPLLRTEQPHRYPLASGLDRQSESPPPTFDQRPCQPRSRPECEARGRRAFRPFAWDRP